jgi:hypothetical protein
LHEGYFVRHNLKFLPRQDHPDFESKHDSNHSDIDVIGYHPARQGHDRVWVVSCKSWQSGFDPAAELRNIRLDKKVRGRKAWQGFRELVKPKWSEAFLRKVRDATMQQEFTYVLAVTKIRGDRTIWEQVPEFIDALEGNPIRVLDLSDMLQTISPGLTKTMASTEVGRMLQLFKAAGLNTNPAPSKRP